MGCSSKQKTYVVQIRDTYGAIFNHLDLFAL